MSEIFAILPIGNFAKVKISEVIRAGLRILEENEKKVMELSTAIKAGEDSGVYENFDPVEHLKVLKAARSNG